MRSLVLAPLVLLLAACLPPHPPPAPAPTELAYVPGCGDAISDPYGTAETRGRFVGAYRNGNTTIAIRDDGARLVLDRPGFTMRQLAAHDMASATFSDGCGIRYSFSPATGPVTTLKITLADGTGSLWSRSDL